MDTYLRSSQMKLITTHSVGAKVMKTLSIIHASCSDVNFPLMQFSLCVAIHQISCAFSHL